MVDSIGRITLYVRDQQEAKKFWVDQMGFVVRLEQPMGPSMTWLEVSPKEDSQTRIVLYEKALMEEQNPQVSTGNPSIIFSSSHVEQAHEDMTIKGISVGELMKMPYGTMFQFQDPEGNSFLLRDLV